VSIAVGDIILFLSFTQSDAVLSSVADRMNISKSDILDPESPDAAVKLALAETHVIQETKTYFESHGVILSAFSGRGRSETIILVKNIPYGTTAELLREMFSVHGELQRVLVPPAGTLAVIEFAHADEARKAFRAISYRRLGNSVIYLEKGPLGMFQPTSETSEVANGVAPIAIEESDAGDDTNVDITSGKTLFVKNLAFATSSERFTQAFRHLPDFAFARLQTKPDPKRPGSRLSMGFGFVGFSSAEAARKALKGMHGYVLDGHSLSVKFAGRGAEEQEEKKGGREKAKTTKMLVKNIPFEATRKDIQALFRYVVSARQARSELLTFFSLQRAWSAQIRSLAEAFRPSFAGLCVPRVRHTTRGRERIQRAQAHALARTPSRVGVGRGGRGEHRRATQKGRCWLWRRF
jgi:multiple RNA-binding domain-containing protein 1